MAKTTFGIPGMRISGKLWGAVLVTMPDGTTVLRQKPERKPRRTAAQEAASARLKPIGEAWRGLAPDEHAAWVHAAGGTGRAAYLMFTALGSKCLQMRPGSPVPLLPPTTAFAGDGIRVGVADLSLDQGTGPHPRPSPEGGVLRFVANAANAPGVVTELLMVRLPNANRRPQIKDYRTRGFVAFTAGRLTAEVPCEPGVWALAVRFVRESTGQEGEVIEIGVREVGVGKGGQGTGDRGAFRL